MIIYGWKATPSTYRTLGVGTCKECQKGPLRAFTLFKYFHIYWVPLFPYSRKLWLNCEHCQATYDVKQAENQSIPANELVKDRFPLRMFAGVALACIIAVIVAIADQKDQEQYQALIENPQTGDMLVFKLENPTDKKYPYGVARVVSSDDNEVRLSPSSYVFPSTSSAKSSKSKKLLDAPDAFVSEKQLVYPRKNLLNLFKEGKISAAMRMGAGSNLPVQPSDVKVPGVQVNVR